MSELAERLSAMSLDELSKLRLEEVSPLTAVWELCEYIRDLKKVIAKQALKLKEWE